MTKQKIIPSGLIALLTVCMIAGAAEIPDDLTGKNLAVFKNHFGKTVTLRGKLEQGKQGACLVGATADDVVFYIVPIMLSSGTFVYPEKWEKFITKQVRITGTLKYRSFGRIFKDGISQTPPNYFYMDMQETKLEEWALPAAQK
jgi:hypothetical protein